jgi:hypothetical protein
MHNEPQKVRDNGAAESASADMPTAAFERFAGAAALECALIDAGSHFGSNAGQRLISCLKRDLEPSRMWDQMPSIDIAAERGHPACQGESPSGHH